jgi:hypothetical protein
MIDIASTEETLLSSREAMNLCHELGFPVKEHNFYNAVTRGYLAAYDDGQGKRFVRADVVAWAEEQKLIASLLTPKQALERIHKRLPSYKYTTQITRLIRAGRMVPVYEADERILFDPADIDVLIDQLINEEKQREAVQDLMETREAWEWINQRLEDTGRSDERVLLDTFYNWVDNGKVPIDVKVPGKNGIFQSWRFSEESLRQAPIFQVPPPMPEDKGTEVENVTSTRHLVRLEADWGCELLTKRGVKDADLSLYAVTKKHRKVRPVAAMGNNLLFPRTYIPRRRPRKPKEVIDL